MKRAVGICLAELHIANDVVTHTIYLPDSTVPMGKFAENEVERNSFEKSEVDRYQNVSNEKIAGHKIEAEDELPP